MPVHNPAEADMRMSPSQVPEQPPTPCSRRCRFRSRWATKVYSSHWSLSRVNLRDADLATVMLNDADLTGAILRYANLFATVLARVDLTGADVSHAELFRGGLSRADLTGATLR